MAIGDLAGALEVAALPLPLPDSVLDLVEGVGLRVVEDASPVVQRLGPCLAVAGQCRPIEDDGDHAPDPYGDVRAAFGARLRGREPNVRRLCTNG